jgi:hypothetical protein
MHGELAARDRERVGMRDRSGSHARGTAQRDVHAFARPASDSERLVGEVAREPARCGEREREIVAARAELELEIAPVLAARKHSTTS